MKLKTIRFILKKCHKIYVIAILLVLIGKNFAQTYKQQFDSIPLSDALIKSSQIFGFKVAFDAGELNKVKINKYVTGNTEQEFLYNLLLNTGYYYKYIHDSYLILKEKNDNKSNFLQNYEITGTVYDNANGEKLPYASIMIPSMNRAICASDNGNFIIKNVIYDTLHLLISYIGYNIKDTIISLKEPVTDCRINLSQKLTKIDSVKIKGKKIEMVEFRGDADFATVINTSGLIDLPAQIETDIFKALQLLPGIRYSENSSELSIRGGSGDQNLILFDGQTLFNLSHYYGLFSTINPNIIKDIQIYKGGFDSRYGERISGIVDITGKTGNQYKPVLYGDVNLFSFNLVTEVPVTEKLTFIGAVRRSYNDIYTTSFANDLIANHTPQIKKEPNEIVIESKPDFKFYDYNFKTTYSINDKEQHSLSIFGGKDIFYNKYASVSQRFDITTIDSNYWNNYGISYIFKKQWNTSLITNLVAGYSGYINNYFNTTNIFRKESPGNYNSFLPDTNNLFTVTNTNKLSDISLSVKNNYILNNNQNIGFGILIRQNTIYYNKNADKIYVYDNVNQKSNFVSIYLQDQISFKNKLNIKPGIRINYYDVTKRVYVEPRFAARLNIYEGLSLRIAAGKYFQYLNQIISNQETSYNKNFWILSNDSTNPMREAEHYIIGINFEKNNFLFDAEAYSKTFNGIQEYIFISPFRKNKDFKQIFQRDNNSMPDLTVEQLPKMPSYYITGSGKAYGIDFFVRYKNKIFTSWLSYSISKCYNQFEQINFNAKIPSVNNQTHQLSLVNMVTINKINISTTTLFSSGTPYILSSDYYGTEIIRTYKKLPDYFRQDVSINYNFSISRLKIKTGFSIINLTNNYNYFDVNTRKFDFGNSSFYETNLIESQNLSFNLFVHFLF
jgi:hypothetical protein